MNAKERFMLEQLSIEFLSGQLIRESHGYYSRRPLAPDSERGREAKAAFVRLLRSDVPLNEEFRCILADLFDPSDSPTHERELVFKNRFPGNPPEWQRDMQLAGYVFYQVKAGIKVDIAIQEAMARFGVARPTAYRAWKTWRALFSKIEITLSDMANDAAITVVVDEDDDAAVLEDNIRALSIKLSR